LHDESEVPVVAAALGALTVSGVLLRAAQTDIARFTIPNILSIALVGSFLALAPFLGLGWVGFGGHVLVGVVSFLVCVALFSLGLYGGGDAKLTPAVMLWLGPAASAKFLFIMVIAGGVLALILLVARALARGRVRHLRPFWLRRMLRVKRGIPYGVAIAIGGLAALPSAIWFSPITTLLR
jgi:prepilin peptidase CpaA